MFFASAAFLAGLALLTIPWWLHRLNAHAAEQRTFSSLFLMRPSEAPVNMRKELQHLFLLALRWLLLIAACVAFAEPFIELTGAATVSDEPEAHRLIVVDASLSMNGTVNGDSAFERAQDEVRDLIGDLPGGVKAALVTVADQLELVAPLTDDRARLTGAVASLAPGNTRLRFDGLMARITTLSETLAAPGERLQVHVFSDFQNSGMPDQFNALIDGSVWPLTLHPVVNDSAANPNRAIAGLRTVQLPSGANTVEVTVRSLGAPGVSVDVTLTQNDTGIGTESVFVAENGSAIAAFELPPVEANDSRRNRAVTWTAAITADDALAADNVRRLVKADTETTDLPVLTSDDRSYAYLRAAVQAAAPRFIPEQVTELNNPVAPVIAVLDPGLLAGGMDRILVRYLESGGAVLLTAGSETRAAGRIPLLDLALAADRFDQTPRGVMALDRSHPALAGFANWQDLTFFQAIRTATGEAGGEVILTLDDGTPLLTEYRIGTGRLMLLGTALDPAWSTLVVRPAFVGFMANLLGYLAEDLMPSEALVGQPFAIPAQSVQLFNEAGERVLGLADTVGRPTVSLSTPGIYQLRTPSSSRLLAVNTDLAESDLAPAPADLLDRWQNTAEKTASALVADEAAGSRPATPKAETAETGHDYPLAPWLLALLALLVLAEPIFANSLYDRRRRSEDAATEATA